MLLHRASPHSSHRLSQSPDMSAPADSTMSGGSVAPHNDSHLEQPNDAVQMKIMPQSPEADESAKEFVRDALEPPSLNDTSILLPELNHSEPADHGETSAAASSKGKQKDEAPEPPAKEDAPMDDTLNMAIGPAQEDIKAMGWGRSEGRSVCNITLLLASGGRHPYKLDAKYLSRRNVAMPDQDENGNPDPFSISIYTLKELILREWRSDWEAKPASPSSIRLIHFGKLLDDKEQLKSMPSN